MMSKWSNQKTFMIEKISSETCNRAGEIEAWGRGIERILEACKKRQHSRTRIQI